MISKRFILCAVATIGLSLNAVGTATAQPYPNRPIKMITSGSAGGPNDAVVRLIAKHLSSSLGQQVIVDNRSGAGGTIAANAVATAAPDGYTLLFATPSFAISQALYKNVSYDPVMSFAPIATVSSASWVLVVAPSVPAESVQELVAYAKANPGKLNYGSALGAATHLLGAMFKVATGTDIVFIPYKGAAPAIIDLMGGQLHMTFENMTSLLPNLQVQKLRALAVTSASRRPELPDVPTLLESGLVGFPTGNWTGVIGPAGTPASIVGKLNSAINESLKSVEIQASFAKLGLEAKIGSPQDFAALLADETPKWAAMVKASGAKVH